MSSWRSPSSRSRPTTKPTARSITLVQGDTQLMPAQATTVTQQFTSNSKIVAVVGPAGSQEVQAVGPLFGRAGMAFITGSATNPALTTSGKNPTFFRVVSRDDVQGPQDAHYVVSHLQPEVADDRRRPGGLLDGARLRRCSRCSRAAGIKVDHESVSQKVTDFSSLVAKVTPQTTVVVLPWQVAANGEQFGKNLAAAAQERDDRRDRRDAVLVVHDPGLVRLGVRSGHHRDPGRRGARGGGEGRVPEVRDVRAAGVRRHARDRRGDRVGVQDRPDAERARTCSRRSRRPTSRPRSSDSRSSSTTKGDLIGAKWFLFKINSTRVKYILVTNT